MTGAMNFAVTFVPAAVAIFTSGKVSEQENFFMRGAKALYRPLLRRAIAHRGLVARGAAVLVLLSLLLASRMGSEFIPNLDEGDLAVHSLRIPGTSLTQAIEMQNAVQKKFLEFPEVKETFAKIGTAEVATDPTRPSVADGFVMIVIGGILSSTALTLLVLPALCRIFHRETKRPESAPAAVQ